MFELSEAIVEQIVFAMEDQERASVVDLETGAVEGAEGREGELFAPTPAWSSREGFKLMEDFLASVRQPSARRELSAALSRGRGVFKAFKAALVAFPDLERSFRDFKLKAMRRSIELWYDELREARGLERLGPEPEETAELVESDFEIRLAKLGEVRGPLLDLIAEAEAESFGALPQVFVDFQLSRLREELARGGEGLCAFCEDGEGGAIGAAAAFRHLVDERSLGRVVFLGVREGFRRLGLGAALLDSLTASFAAEGTSQILLDLPLLPQSYAERLSLFGYRPFGARAFRALES